MKAGRKKKDQKNEKGKWQPTEEQKRAVELLFTTGMTNKQIASELKIAEQTFYNWLDNENFIEYIEMCRKRNFATYMPRIDNSVVFKALGEGPQSMSAARTIYEKRGEINSDKEAPATTIVLNIQHE